MFETEHGKYTPWYNVSSFATFNAIFKYIPKEKHKPNE